MASNRGSVKMELREPCTDEKARSGPTPIFIKHCPSCWREGQKTEEIQFSKVNEGNKKDGREASIQNIDNTVISANTLYVGMASS